jgi:hypothetical protein
MSALNSRAASGLMALAWCVAGAFGLAARCDAASGQEILIRGAKVHTVTDKGTLDNTDVLLRAGKIAAVGAGLDAPAGVTVVEANGRSLTPGIFAGLNDIGLEEVSGEPSTVNAGVQNGTAAWQSRWRPEFDVLPAFNPRSMVLPVTRIEGLTWTMLTPHSDNLVAGQGAAVVLDGRYDAALPGSRALFINFEDDSFTSSGGSRAAQYMLLDQAIRESREAGTPGPNMLLQPAGREALARYLKGGRVVFGVNRAADIRQVLTFARAHGMKPVISGGAEAWAVAADIASVKAPVLLNPLDDLPATFDSLGARLDNAALLDRAGVRIAFSLTGDTHNARKVRQLAGNAVAHGLSWDAALAAITANPAEIFGQADRGRIAVGQVADVVLWSGDPLEVDSVADQVWIAGKPIEMRSRQTELRDRYLAIGAR